MLPDYDNLFANLCSSSNNHSTVSVVWPEPMLPPNSLSDCLVNPGRSFQHLSVKNSTVQNMTNKCKATKEKQQNAVVRCPLVQPILTLHLLAMEQSCNLIRPDFQKHFIKSVILIMAQPSSGNCLLFQPNITMSQQALWITQSNSHRSAPTSLNVVVTFDTIGEQGPRA